MSWSSRITDGRRLSVKDFPFRSVYFASVIPFAGQIIPSGVTTSTYQWETDERGWCDGQYFTFPTNGFLIFEASARFSSNATGYRAVQVRRNGDRVAGNWTAAATGGVTCIQAAYVGPVVAGDVFDIAVVQSSGGDRILDLAHRDTCAQWEFFET